VTTVRPDLSAGKRLVVVSFMSNVRYSPRGIRTRALLASLEREWKVDLVGGPSEGESGLATTSGIFRPIRKVLRFAYSSTLLDKFEPWSWRRFHSWEPDAEAALLIAFPFSPIVYAASQLRRHGIPYIVDAGDPWVLTGQHPELRGLARLRARAAERRLWAGAAAAIVTTDAQALALRRLFPELRFLVRPNGFSPDDDRADRAGAEGLARPDSTLRLAHYGDISSDRVPIEGFLEALAKSPSWDRVEFHQFGRDWTGNLDRLTDVRVVFHEPRPWNDVIDSARHYDLAVVIGNRDPMLLPSKAVAYLQLPIPRLALVADRSDNALADYVRTRPGWLVLSASDCDTTERTRIHLSTPWSADQLKAPLSESWDQVCRDIGDFVKESLETGDAESSGMELAQSRSLMP
jgi:glycosyltransferase involved in cell wall biosynthesis